MRRFLCSVLVLLSSIGMSRPGNMFSESLSRLDSFMVAVVIDGDRPPTLDEDRIRTDVELRLRMAGIHVNEFKQESFDVFSLVYPFILVTVFISESSSPAGFYGTSEMRLVQFTSITEPGIYKCSRPDETLMASGIVPMGEERKVLGVIWENGLLFLTGDAQARTVRDGIKDLVDNFINDWLRDNLSRGAPP